mgnify:CR=1 FL=1
MANPSNSVEELMELERESFRRRSANDFDWMINAHAAEALMFPLGAEMMRAQDILKAAKERIANSPSGSSKSTFSWEPTAAAVSESDDMGYVYGTTKEEMSDGDIEHGKYVSIWIKEDGEWKVVVEIRNTN